ncbi:hypothetical protein TELCIR_17682, partial [Teladorsagia circumcincta]
CIYTDQIGFTPIRGREKVLEIDVLGDPTNLDKANDELGLAFDAHDLLYYKDLFVNKFKSSIRGFDDVPLLLPSDPTTTSPMEIQRRLRHLTYSAETHNFPTAVCPFQVLIEASNGASDYGNKFGEPVVCGFARSFGQRLLNGERCEYVKPIMFSGGIGAIDDDQTKKESCREGMLLAKFGGPVYRVGVGGGAASSQSVQGSRESALDFCAVQRGDAEMGQKLHRVVRACAELGTANPILSIHDQGAGGNGNVLKELVEGGGAVINADSFELGDETISARELWTAEYQENDAALVDAKRLAQMMAISRREKCTVSIVGTVTDENRVVLTNFADEADVRKPVDFDTKILGEREKKVFHLNSTPMPLRQLELPAGLSVRQALEMVLRLPSVASKRYLTSKVDRSVTGLVARQQCVGPLHTPLADVAVVALSYFDK